MLAVLIVCLACAQAVKLSEKSDGVDKYYSIFNTTRVPGSEGSLVVQESLVSHFAGLKTVWELERDTFTENGYEFTNLVFDYRPVESTSHFITVAAHYDSKLEPRGFIRAIDSGVSCSLMMHIARELDDVLGHSGALFNDVGLRFIFFDGEEAFAEWTDTDSIYGARHLASKWKSENRLEEISLFVLLDLLGSDQNTISSFYAQTHDKYFQFAELEKSLRESKKVRGTSRFFKYSNKFRPPYGQVSDDHLPFLRENVPILHLIPLPFPSQWHTLADTYDKVSPVNVRKWSMLLMSFLLTELDIEWQW